MRQMHLIPRSPKPWSLPLPAARLMGRTGLFLSVMDLFIREMGRQTARAVNDAFFAEPDPVWGLIRNGK